MSLDYMVGDGMNAKFDKQTVKRLEDIERLPNEEKNIVYRMIDMALVYSKTKRPWPDKIISDMKVLLEIKDDKAAFFLEVLKNFSFVKAKPLVEENSQLLQELEQAVHNVNLAKQGKLKPKPLSELLDEL